MTIDPRHLWHAGDCGGYPFCDGCGHIADDGLWYSGPAPEAVA
jgi:hypothetical protein